MEKAELEDQVLPLRDIAQFKVSIAQSTGPSNRNKLLHIRLDRHWSLKTDLMLMGMYYNAS